MTASRSRTSLWLMTRGWNVNGSDGMVVGSFLPIATSAVLAPRSGMGVVGRKGKEAVVLSEDLFDGLHCLLRSTIALRIAGAAGDMAEVPPICKYGTLLRWTGCHCLKQPSLERHDGRKSSLISRSPLLMSSWAGMWRQYTLSNSPPAPGNACFRTHNC